LDPLVIGVQMLDVPHEALKGGGRLARPGGDTGGTMPH
jgi:hypothetical protein